MKGILLEVRAQLPIAERKHLDIESGALVLRVPEDDAETHRTTAKSITNKLIGMKICPSSTRGKRHSLDQGVGTAPLAEGWPPEEHGNPRS